MESTSRNAVTAIECDGYRFQTFNLKPELELGIKTCGFEYPSEVQQACIPKACMGMDILCQARNGIGKTLVYIISTLQQLPKVEGGNISSVVICPTRELALQVGEQFKRLCEYLPDVKIETFFGGLPVARDEQILLENPPDVMIGTPGRILQLLKKKKLNLNQVRNFIIDECDEVFQNLSMRRTVQEIFISTPQDKQVMMFSATIPRETKIICKKFMNEPYEFFMEDDIKMNLLGLQQYYACSENASKTRTLLKFIGEWKFNQAIIFVSNSRRCDVLAHILNKLNHSTISIHKGLTQVERMSRHKEFIDAEKKILVTTNLFGRGMNNHRINLVINYDTPNSTISYLHRATRARPSGEDARILTLVCSEKEATFLTAVQEQFEVDIRKIEDISADDDVNLESSSLLWAEDTMNRLCAEFENAKFL